MRTASPHGHDLTKKKRRTSRWSTMVTAGALLFVALGATPQGDSREVTLTPERTLRIEFITTPPFIETNPNVLSAFLGYVTILAPYGQITGSLYDGNTLLGTATSTVGAGFTGTYSFHPVPVTWKTAGSPWDPFSWSGPGNAPAVVDFASIHDGTIAGRIDIVIDAGRIELDLDDISLWTMFATYSNGGSSIPPYPIVMSAKLIPELPDDPEPPPPPPPVPPPSSELDDDDDLSVTTADLKLACEQSAGNAVRLDHSAKISNGFAAEEHIESPCTLILGNNVVIDVEQAAITFDGPLTVQSAQRGEVKFDRSAFIAPTLNINLPGTSSAVILKDSTLRAEGGDLLVALGEESKLEIVGAFSGESDALSAAGAVFVRGAQKFLGQVTNAGVHAQGNIEFDLAGAEAVLKAQGASFASDEGSVVVAGAGTKALVELTDTDVEFADAATIRLNPADAMIKLALMAFTGSGPVTLEAGIGTAANGVIEVLETAAVNVTSLTVRASLGGTNGFVKVAKSTVVAAGDIRLETGPNGKTEETENTAVSGTTIRIATGSGGSCSTGSGSLTAPVVQACQ